MPVAVITSEFEGEAAAQPPIPNQPALPAEDSLNEVEKLFIEESPVGLWPENQDSNFGQVRRVITQPLDDVVVLVEELYNERFLDTMSGYIGRWERELSLPRQTSKTNQQRTSIISSHLKKGAFTRARRDALIEEFIQATFGTSVALTPEGVSLPAGGVPLFADTAPVSTLYRVYENIADSSYVVWIVNTVTPDLTGLQRELAHFTPAGINFTIDNTKSNILDYQRAVLDDGPTLYYPLSTTTGTGNPWQSIAGISSVLTVTSAPANVSALVQNGGGVVADTQARDFDGVDDRLTVPIDANALALSSSFSVEAWCRIDAFPTSGNYGFLWTLSGAGVTMIFGIANYSGTNRWAFRSASQLSPTTVFVEPAITSVFPSLSTVYHVVGTWNGFTQKFYVNGNLINSYTPAPGNWIVIPGTGGGIAGSNGGSHPFNGVIDEPAIYGYVLSGEQILRHYNTGINVL